MAVPTVMSDLSTTIASNSPAGSDSPTQGDDNIRAIMGIVRRQASSGSDIASGTTITPDALASSYNVTGTTTITTIATTNGWPGRLIVLTFTGALILTHNASTLILPGGANITTAANDHAIIRQIGSNAQECIAYVKASGLAIVLPTLAQIDTNWSFDSSHRLLNGGNTQPAFYANTLTTQSAGTTLIYDSASSNQGSAYNAATGVFTAPVAGWYFFSASGRFNNTSGGTITNEVTINKGSNFTAIVGSLTALTGNNVDWALTSGPIKLALNDTISVVSSTTLTATYRHMLASFSNFSGSLLY